MIPINVAAKSLSATLCGIASELEAKQRQRTSTRNIEKDRKLLHHLRLDANALFRFSRKVPVQGKAIRPDVVGYLSSVCYGHIRLTTGLIDILREDGQDDTIADLSAISNPFYERGAYAITVLSAYC